jgi:Protein of unknown function (DUF3631)
VPKRTTSSQKFAGIFAMFTRGATPEERANAECAMDGWLKRHRKTRADIPSILAQALADDAASQPPPPPSDPRDAAPVQEFPNVTVCALVYRMLELYVCAPPHDLVAATLWAIHTHVHDRYMITPRLNVISPVVECGKSTLLKVLGRLVARPEHVFHPTAAALANLAHEERCTILFDDVDSLDPAVLRTLRGIINVGHDRSGGARIFMHKGRMRRQRPFTPLALASIGPLWLAAMSRGIIINMVRNPDGPARLFDLNDTKDLDIVYSYVRRWAHDVVLEPRPVMPEGVTGRLADNWRVLIAIADACGPVWGARARDAAVAFGAHQDEPVLATLLRDILAVFDKLETDRLASKLLVHELLAMEDAIWQEWRGLDGKERRRRLTQVSLANALRTVRIFSRTIWPRPRTSTSKSAQGYLRGDFEQAWNAYCRNTATQSSAAKQLRLA